MTPCRFEEAWSAWCDGPRIWGGIPSPLLEDRCTVDDFRGYMDGLLKLIDRPVILGITDLFMHHNSLERVRDIAAWIEAGEVCPLEELRREG